MKKMTYRFCAGALLLLTVFCFPLKAKNVRAYFNYAAFNTPDNKPYIETYMSIVGKSVTFKKNQNNKFQASVEIGVAYLLDNEIKFAKKYNLLSPEVEDTSKGLPVFIDVQRVQLGTTGSYILEMEITDKNNETPKPVVFKQDINLHFNNDSLGFSDVELVETLTPSITPGTLTKSGYDLLPYISNFYHEKINNLSFYAELYQTKKVFSESEKFLVTYSIESYETGNRLANYYQFTKQSPRDIITIIGEFPLQDLPTGNYYLALEVRDKSNKVLTTKKTFFQRRNAKAVIQKEDLSSVAINQTFVERITNKDSLKEYIACLRPIASSVEQNFIDHQAAENDLKIKQQFLYNFWQKRAPENPQKAFNEYMVNVKYVNEVYSATNFKGYQTERGRVYLRYGKPDQLTKFDFEPNNYPYEIWQFYKTDKRNNRKFIFYNPDISGNNYDLLHSDAVGEKYDPRWQIKLNKRNNRSTNLDDTNSPDTYGNRASDFFENPR